MPNLNTRITAALCGGAMEFGSIGTGERRVMLDLLKTFCAVVDSGSLSKAAESLHLTQPAVTRKVHALEKELGAVLFQRTSRGMELTPAGRAVLKHARQAVAAVQACQGAALTASARAESRLRIAAGINVTMYCLPGALARFRERWPGVQVDLRPGHYREAIDRVLNYEADVAIIGSDVLVPGLRELQLLADPLVLISPPGSEGGPVRLAELNGASLLIMPAQSGLRREVEQVLEQQGIRCSLVEFPSPETLKGAVSLGMGSAIVPTASVQEDVRAKRLVMRPLMDWPLPARMVRALVRKEGATPEPARRFIELLREGADGSRRRPPEVGA